MKMKKNINIKDIVAKAILCYEDEEIVDAWNMYCSKKNKEDYRVYRMGEFDEVYREVSPSQIASDAKSSKFNPDQDDYFAYDEIGCLTSFTKVDDSDSVIELKDLAEWLISSNGKIDGCRVVITATDIWDTFTTEYLSEIYEGGIRLTMAYVKDFCRDNGIDFDTLDVFNFDFNTFTLYYAEKVGAL